LPLALASRSKAWCSKYKITDMSIDFTYRSSAIEIMDDLACDGEVVFQTLRELDIINQWLGGNAVTVNALKNSWKKIPKEYIITIADLGCGGGEMLRIISKLAEKENRKVRLTGFDANPHIIEYARSHSKDFSSITFETTNVFSKDFQNQKFDFVLATLFLHHFSEDELTSLFFSLKNQTRSAIIINDIHRHPLAYYSIKWLTQWFSRSAMVRFDAPLSVMRAFKKNELSNVLKKAEIKNYLMKWKWAFRWQLIIPLNG
jgi:2-polyprenyl-3-methyl-5-hydroxy-6-metoxy-1,4-benzoquinol methylase